MATLLTSDRHVAEDVYQETLHRLFMRWSRVDSPRAFCRRVMHNIVIDRARAQQRRPRELQLRDNYDGKDPRSGDPVSAAELRPTVLAALDTLPVQQRAIVVAVKTGTTDKTGRSAIEISRYDGVAGEESETFESPSTGAVLEQAFSDVGTDVYAAVTGYATLPANPYSGG
jgi:RNA polymerase sigma factor (sigma-70 family)